MKGIVREVKGRDTEDKFLTINCMKSSVILGKALLYTKREHLEASVYEFQEAVKELKGRGRAKAKAKSKAKHKEIEYRQ